MAVSGVVVDARILAGTYFGHHVRHHRPQARPGYDMLGIDARHQATGPGNQWSYAVVANVIVHAIEFSGTRDAQAIFAQSAGYDLGLVIQQADPCCSFPAFFVRQFDRDRITFDWIDIDPVTQLRGESTAFDTGTDNHTVKAVAFDTVVFVLVIGDIDLVFPLDSASAL